MVDFVLGRLRFKFKGDWAVSTAFLRDDVITYGGRSYVCLTNHTSSSNASGGFYSDAANWELMTDGTEWKNNWATSTYYKVNDLIKYGARIYICSNGHTSNATSSGGFYSDSGNWQLYADGYQNVLTWTPSTYYKINDVVKFGARLYLANTGHTSSATANSGFYADGSNWQLLNDGIENYGTWATSRYYKINDIVKFGARSYIATAGHTSSATANSGFYSDSSNWQLLNDGMENRGSWASGYYYRINDIVKWGAELYICNTGHTAGTNWVDTEANFTLLVGGLEFQDSYDAGTLYQPGDIVRYGGYQFVATNETTGNLPTNTSYWDVLSTGFNHEGDYNNGTAYQPGDVVRYGAYTYVAKQDSTGNIPTNTTYWDLLNKGIRWLGDYDNSTGYVPGDMVRWGGYTYEALLNTTGQTPHSNTSAWARQVTGMSWRDAYDANTTYQLGDVVRSNGASWISTANNNLGVTPNTSSNTYWSVVAQGDTTNVLTYTGDLLYQAAGGLQRLPIGANGQVLSIHSGIPNWEDNSYANNVFYVSSEGDDSPTSGTTLQRPFKTIKYATGHVANTVAAGSKTTIFVKNGTYSEQLPITVPANTAIMGDAQRTVVVTAAGGNDDTGTKLNSQSTMWLLSDGTLLKQMTFTGMTGYVPGSPEDDITAATVGGVFARFNPASPIATKSPYILECSAISNGGIGVIVDGSVHASGYKSMVFHAYTNLNNDGVGYWVKDNGRAEIVSCFSYYCWFGLATSGGGFIRGLNNNNSYGRYGAVSRGFDTTETPHYGKIYGQQLQFDAGSTMAFNVGEFIVGANSSANGIITNVQGAADKLYYWPVSGTFQNSETVTGVTSTTTAITTSSGVTGQKGYVIVANGFNDEPSPGRSIQFDDDANNAYVIQSVSGTYTDSNSRIVLVLAQEKLNPSSNAANVSIRANFSQIRLTGHDFLDIGTGNTATANVPGTPLLPLTQSNEVVEYKPGRVYYVSTDQNGNFRVGEYFRIDQATGRATLDASAFDLAGLTSLKLGSIGAQLGETINEFSSDVTMGGDSNLAVPTEHAVKTYVDTELYARNQETREPTGFNRSSANSMGVIEFSQDGTTVYTMHSNGSTYVTTDGKFANNTPWQTTATAKTVRIRPENGQSSFSVWQSGKKYSYTTAQSNTYSNFNSTKYFWMDQADSNTGSFRSETSMTGDWILSKPFVATIYGNEDNGEVIIFADERHGITMDGATHYYLHTTAGTRFNSGLGVSTVTANATSYTSTVSGRIYDEDIILDIPTQTTNRFLYLDSTGLWRHTTASNTYAYMPSSTAQYNEKVSPGVYQLTNLAAGEYAVMYFIATNCKINYTQKVIGQRKFTSLSAARESAQTEPRDTSLLGLPAAEFLYVGAVVVDYQGQVQTLDNGGTYVDLRLVNISGGVNSSTATPSVAADVYYNNTVVGLSTTNVQAAITQTALIAEEIWLTPLYNAATVDANTGFFANGRLQFATENQNINVNTILYNTNGMITNWTETYLPTNTRFNYAVTYYANGYINTITRI